MVSFRETVSTIIKCVSHIYVYFTLGPEFQTRIRQNEQNNPKFNFLNIGDPYHAYYQHKVKEFHENDGKSKIAFHYKQLFQFIMLTLF